MRKCVGAVDIGGTKILAALVDSRGEVLSEIKLATEAWEGSQEVIERTVEALRQLWRERTFDCKLYGLGVAVAGNVDPKTGIIGLAPNLGWRDLAVKDQLAEILAMPVLMDNDANCGALGEHHFGAGRGIGDLLYVTVSTGIGSGYLSQGKLLLGKNGAAGELGHLVLEPQGEYCSCGRRGCLETLASGSALTQAAQKLIAQGGGQAIRNLEEAVSSRAVNQAAQAGDPESRAILEQAADYLIRGLEQAAILLDPALIILGGGALPTEGAYWQLLQEKLAKLPPAANWPLPPVVPAQLGERACLIGAAALAWQEL